MNVSMKRFEEAVHAAIEAIPARYQPYLEDIEFVVARRSPEGLFGLYEGAGVLGETELPARVTIYRDAHEAACGTWKQLLAEVRRTVLHEVGHHFQMEEQELPW